MHEHSRAKAEKASEQFHHHAVCAVVRLGLHGSNLLKKVMALGPAPPMQDRTSDTNEVCSTS